MRGNEKSRCPSIRSVSPSQRKIRPAQNRRIIRTQAVSFAAKTPPHRMMATRSSAHNGIEPTKHLLKQYLAGTHLTVLASAFTCREKHIFLRTSQSVVQILAAAASPIVFRLTHKRWTLNLFRHVGQ